ncbi:MAG: hypothetical protein QOF16_762, partial [Actinomycetota bacterium]|nr:hypothetical protein [Actinomycetota bacterium]
DSRTVDCPAPVTTPNAIAEPRAGLLSPEPDTNSERAT